MNEHFESTLGNTNHRLDKEMEPLVNQVQGMNKMWESLKLESPEAFDDFITFADEHGPEIVKSLQLIKAEKLKRNEKFLNTDKMFDEYFSNLLTSDRHRGEREADIYASVLPELTLFASRLSELIQKYQTETTPSAHA